MATSALTGAAAVTAVVDSHPAPFSRAASGHGRVADAVSSASRSPGGWQPSLALSAEPVLVTQLVTQQAQAPGNVLLTAQRQNGLTGLSGPAPVQTIGAIGVNG